MKYLIIPRDLNHPIWASDATVAADLCGIINDEYDSYDELNEAMCQFGLKVQEVRSYTQEKNPLEYNKEQVECIPDDEHLADFVMSLVELLRKERTMNGKMTD